MSTDGKVTCLDHTGTMPDVLRFMTGSAAIPPGVGGIWNAHSRQVYTLSGVRASINLGAGSELALSDVVPLHRDDG